MKTKIESVQTQFLIPSTKLHNIREYIENKVNIFENKIFSTENGYLTKIHDVNDIQFDSLSYPTHDGAIVVSCLLIAEFVNVKKNDIFECEVFQDNDVIFSKQGPLCIIIRPGDTNKKIKCGDTVSVRVATTEIDIQLNIIKVVCDLVD